MYNKEISPSGTNLGYNYFIDYEHPLATGNSGRILLHRHLISMQLGRWISKDEHVHHIDENKLNNEINNLRLVSLSEHNKIHNPKTILTCLECSSEYTTPNNDTTFCSRDCFIKSKIKNKGLTKEVLDALIPTHSWVALGKLFGYSDTGIKKRAKALGCVVPKRKQTSP
jgi:hypothetical protein